LQDETKRDAHFNPRLANAFSYWQGQDISNATASYFDDIQQAVGHIQEVSGSLDAIRIMNGETGWPTGECFASCFRAMLTASRWW
jgi:exo-beta-1,3-glucanase (GH17 family)